MCYNGLNSGMPFPIGPAPMPRRPAALLTSPRDISNSSLFVVLDHEIEKHPFPFQLLPHSFAKTPGVSSSPFRHSFKKHFNSCRKPPLLRSFAPQRSPSPSFSIRCTLFLCLPGMESLFDFPRSTVDRYHRKSRRTSTCEKNSPYAVYCVDLSRPHFLYLTAFLHIFIYP